MEDSSTNPYIPQASGSLQAKVKKQQTSFARIAKTVLIVGGVLIVLLGIALVFMIPRSSVVDEKARADLANVVQPIDKLSKLITIKSTLGFSVSYQDQLFSSYGEVGAARINDHNAEDQISGEHYENNDLKKERQYGMVRITPRESVDTSRSAVTLPPELEIRSYDKAALLLTDEAKKAEKDTSKTGGNSNATPKGELAISTLVAIDSKKRLGDKTSDDGTTVSIEASKPTSVDIGGIDYQKVRFMTRNENYRITTESYDDCYYSIQNSQPYSVCVVKVRPDSVAPAALLEDTLRQVSYQSPEDSKDVSLQPAIKLASAFKLAQAGDDEQADSAEVTPQVTVTPAYVKDEASLKAIAKNQPSIVRIGTLYCANLLLKLADGSTNTTLSDACVGKTATGTFISNDGYIATTGQAVRFEPKDAINGYINFAENRDEMFDRLQRVLDYMLKAGHILETDAEYLKTGAETGDQDALAKIENLGSVIPDDYVQVSGDAYTYAIQPTDKPIVINRSAGNKPSFAYSDAVLSAKFFKGDYDTSKSAQENFASPTSSADVALLKVDGTFPTVKIGNGDDVKANQKLVTVGWPAYADSSLTIDKILNIPVATNRGVEQTFKKDEHFLMQTNTPILPGNDGAPTFDANNMMVGFGVYGHKYCPDQQCFGSGTVRSVNGLMAMIDKNNIELSTGSAMADAWAKGVDAYFIGNYQVAAAEFTNAGNAYRFNQIAKPLADLAVSKYGSPSDTSLINQLVTGFIVTIVVLVIAMTGLGVLLFIHLRRLDTMQVGHYGEVQASPAPAMPTPAPQMPQQPPVSPFANQPSVYGYGAPTAPVQPGPQQFGSPMATQPPAPVQSPVVSSQPQTSPAPLATAPVIAQRPADPLVKPDEQVEVKPAVATEDLTAEAARTESKPVEEASDSSDELSIHHNR